MKSQLTCLRGSGEMIYVTYRFIGTYKKYVLCLDNSKLY